MVSRAMLMSALVVLVLCIGLTTSSLSELRRKICNSETDCVRVTTATGNIMIDELDFAEDTVDAIRSKLPSWFGPARPIQFLFRDKVVPEDKKLAEIGIVLGGVLKLMSVPPKADGEL